jgi:FlaA1/EpsC-like NDP-sugar epimerase
MDRTRLDRLLTDNEVEIILHAAAYKHVPLVEANGTEGVKNNIFGTHTLAEAARAANIERFILISTDKAVRPTNIMGATKRLAELVVQDIQTRSDTTKFAMVRFGNVLGSSGSVIPLFREQIAAGGPVTLTDPDVTRYFMTIPEASRLVLLAGAYATGGDVFVLDMGEPVVIGDLARRMIELSGRSVKDDANPDGDIEIEIVGLRPGEKLYEELLIDNNMLTTPHEKILRASEESLTEIQVAATLRKLSKAIEENDIEAIRAVFEERVSGYSFMPRSNAIAGE